MSRFQTTRWSLIAAAADDRPACARAALEELCRAYRPPVLAYIRRNGQSAHDAEDLAQAFFLRFLERGWYAQAAPQRGRFRALVLTSLRHFLADAHAHRVALRRGGSASMSDDFSQVVATEGTPEQAFDRAWLGTVLTRAMQNLEREWTSAGKGEQFVRLLPVLVEPPDADAIGLLAAEQGVRRNTLAVQLHRMRMRLRQLVRIELLQTVSSREALECELDELRAVLPAPLA